MTKKLNDSDLKDVSGAGTTKSPMDDDNIMGDNEILEDSSIQKTITNSFVVCIYCGDRMKSSKKIRSGSGYECPTCGATYNPSLPNPWQR